MNLFPKEIRPYYIYTPSYTAKSSGVRTLHLLCHALNESGYKAQLLMRMQGYGGEKYFVNPNLNTPVAYTGEFENPIVIYPDIVTGNPMRAKSVVRYLLAPRGAYGGDKEFPETDQIWGALPSIAENVLRLPVCDTNVFYPPSPSESILGNGILRMGECFYSHKYEMHGNKHEDPGTRLEGTQEQIADILRRSSVCRLYEVSSIITEAGLCGCPVELMRTPYFNTIDPECMMGDVRWSDGEIVKKCDNYLPEYEKIVADFPRQLRNFIEKTQSL